MNMTRDIIRLIVTAFIWLMVGLIGMMSIAIPEAMSSGAVIITTMGLIFGYTTTRSIWRGLVESDHAAIRAEPVGKRKRGDGDTKVELLLALMDDDEREAFKEALKAQMLQGRGSRLSDDGEIEPNVSIATLESLLNDEQRRR